MINVKIRKPCQIIELIQKSSFFLRNSNEKIPLNRKLKNADKYDYYSPYEKTKERPAIGTGASLIAILAWDPPLKIKCPPGKMGILQSLQFGW
jgi:hypothetical protein